MNAASAEAQIGTLAVNAPGAPALVAAAVPAFDAGNAGSAQAPTMAMALPLLMNPGSSQPVAVALAVTAADPSISGSSGGNGMVAGNVPGLGAAAAQVENSAALTQGITNQSAADALAVNTAEAQYLAATGTALNGAGLKIGILSDSFNLQGGMASEIANGDLPSAGNIHILQEGTSGQDEGQALAELIHSIAPAAQIYFYSAVNSQAQMATGIGALVTAGVNVIVDDVTYTNEPFFQDTGLITQAAEAAVAAGVSYFTSAGNSGTNYYEAAFNPLKYNLPGIGNVTTSDVYISRGLPFETIQIGADATLDMTLQWTQPFGANQYDLGMALYTYYSGTYTLVQNFTTSSLGGDPVLTIDEATQLAAGTYYMAFYESGSNLVNGQPVKPGTFKIVAFSDSNVLIDGIGSQTGSGTSIGHELAPGVNSVAAIRVSNTPSEGVAVPVAETFSSAGIGKTYISASGATLATPISDKTPDFSATDGSPTSIFNPFYGTSAAVANAAGVGLLVLQADTRLTPAQVTDVLEASAISTGNATTGGAGLIQASTAVAEALQANTTPIWTAQGATTLWGTAANWSDNALPQASSNVVISDGLGIFTGAYTVNFNATQMSISSLDVDGGTVTGALPALLISPTDQLTAGSVTIGAGTVDVAGTLIDSGALAAGSSAGLIEIASTGSVALAGSSAAANIAFLGSGGTLYFTTANAATMVSGLEASISNFESGDVIDLSGLPASSVQSLRVEGPSVLFLNSSGGTLAQLNISGATAGMSFIADRNGGTQLISGTTPSTVGGNVTINTAAATATIYTSGNGNVVGMLAGSTTVNAGGSNDLIETFNAGVSALVNVTGANENILVDGGADTVYANAGQTGTNAFFNLSGGSMYFINNSTAAASVTGAVNGAIGGAVTALGGAGGGTYVGGPGGNNSLIGGTGLVTLIGSGTGNFLQANGSVTGGASNLLWVGNSGSSTLVASATTNWNEFVGGASGTTSMFAAGSGQQNFFVGNGDTETLTGSTVAGAQNIYRFEAPANGGGTDFITNFKLGSSNQIVVDEQGTYAGQVVIAGAETVGGGQGGTTIQLTDNTSIKLIGTYMTQAQIASITGSNGFM